MQTIAKHTHFSYTCTVHTYTQRAKFATADNSNAKDKNEEKIELEVSHDS